MSHDDPMRESRRPSFGFANYAAFRPSYPPELYSTIFAYHNEGNGDSFSSSATTGAASAAGTLVDLGTGHGMVARALASRFSAVHAVDPSEGMIEQARQELLAEQAGGGDQGHHLHQDQETRQQQNIQFRHGKAEDLSFLPEASVDMVVSGQAAHWFDFSFAWPSLARAVRPGGTLAFWGYKDFIMLGHPASTIAFNRGLIGRAPIGKTKGKDGGDDVEIQSMGGYWESSGTRVLLGNFAAVEPPEAEWGHVRRIVFDPDRRNAAIPEDTPGEALWLRKRLKLGELESFARTFSAYSNWRAAHPAMRMRAEGGEGDVVDFMFDQVVAATPEWAEVAGRGGGRGGEGDWREIEVEVVWGTVILLARRL